MPAHHLLHTLLGHGARPWSVIADGRLVDIHRRVVPGTMEHSGALLDSLGSSGSVWPSERWPDLIIDGGLGVGHRGGHGSIRYEVSEYEPGRRVRFLLTPDFPVAGWHELALRPAPASGVEWRHTLVVTDPTAVVRLLVEPLHDALLEDLLDAVTAALSGIDAIPRPLSPANRLRRRLAPRRPEDKEQHS